MDPPDLPEDLDRRHKHTSRYQVHYLDCREGSEAQISMFAPVFILWLKFMTEKARVLHSSQ